MRRSKKTSKLRVSGFCEGNSPVTVEFPALRASNAEMFLFDDVIISRQNPAANITYLKAEAVLTWQQMIDRIWAIKDIYSNIFHNVVKMINV